MRHQIQNAAFMLFVFLEVFVANPARCSSVSIIRGRAVEFL